MATAGARKRRRTGARKKVRAARATTARTPLRAGTTSRDVAQLAGVSRSAVSRTFTPDASVSEATRRKVLAAAAELGYQPNVLARSLITDRSRLIGLVMGEWQNPFYATMLRLLSEKLQRREYQLMLLTATPEDDVAGAVRRLLQYRAEAILMVSCTPDPALAQSCVRDGTRLVVVNRDTGAMPVTNVSTDNARIGRDVAQLLLQAGYRRIGVVRGDPNVSVAKARTEAFKATVAASRRARLVLDQTGVVGYAAGREMIRAVLRDGGPRPDAIFCASDLTAIGALDGARLDLGLDVPGQLGIVGLGDAPVASWAPYDLTTVQLPIEPLIDAAVEALLAPATADARRAIVVDSGIVQRSTVRGPRR
ncbi:MAG: LacI family transcriptional regulator [Steroidobacteraceae bacterium]|jgi:DNA-binding LacI/PurR family transcriptional regulator|nr:LacI family transcriptional regulator [Steroidobacteraceae bacterium]